MQKGHFRKIFKLQHLASCMLSSLVLKPLLYGVPDLVNLVHLVCLLLEFPVLLQGLPHMLQGTVQQPHRLRPLLDSHIGLSHVVAAEGLEGKQSCSGLLLPRQVFCKAGDVTKISHMLW